MSLKHIPKTYLNSEDFDNHIERLTDRKLSAKARKLGFKDVHDMYNYLGYLGTLGGAKNTALAKYIIDLYRTRGTPHLSGKSRSRKDWIRFYQGEGYTKKEAVQILLGGGEHV